MRRTSIDDCFTLVHTNRHTYLGYMVEQEGQVVLHQAATIDSAETDPRALAYHYFVQKAKRKIQEQTIPEKAIESMSPQKHATMLYHSYEELSKVSGKGQFGKIKIRRLENLLGGGYR